MCSKHLKTAQLQDTAECQVSAHPYTPVKKQSLSTKRLTTLANLTSANTRCIKHGMRTNEYCRDRYLELERGAATPRRLINDKNCSHEGSD